MPEIPQDERRGNKLAVTYYNSSTGGYELRPLLGGGDGSAHVLDGITQVPRYSVAPTVDGTPVGEMYLNCGAAGFLWGVRFTLFTDQGSGDAPAAAGRLAASANDVRRVFPNRTEIASVAADGSDGNITDVYAALVMRGGTDAATADGIVDDAFFKAVPALGNLAHGLDMTFSGGITEAMLLGSTSSVPHMLHLEFDADDQVRHVVFDMSDIQVSRLAQLAVEGWSYA